MKSLWIQKGFQEDLFYVQITQNLLIYEYFMNEANCEDMFYYYLFHRKKKGI